LNILLHTCCSNCSVYSVNTLRSINHEVTGFWFNPNIHPSTEYDLRLKSMQKLVHLWKMDMIYHDEYGLVDFLRAVVGKEDTRCRYCYRIRLERTAYEAAQKGFDAFCTTLLISPYQDFDTLIALGDELSQTYGVSFYGEDFRLGFKEGMAAAKELGLYRQKYCGCVYSEINRYMTKKYKKNRESRFSKEGNANV
jgi:predicted adenine nucleotide alpha hydrolase (AANH) superfamily ATPase